MRGQKEGAKKECCSTHTEQFKYLLVAELGENRREGSNEEKRQGGQRRRMWQKS